MGVIPEEEAMVCILGGGGVWDLATAGAFPFDTPGCGAGVILDVDVLGGGVAFTGVASTFLIMQAFQRFAGMIGSLRLI